MTLQRMDNVGVVVDDLEAAISFFLELGMELEGEAALEGPWVDRIVGLDDVRAAIAMLRTPDGHGRLGLGQRQRLLHTDGQVTLLVPPREPRTSSRRG